MRTRTPGFSLLEVMVAVAILGLTLTVILSAQGGLAASNKMAGNMGLATTVGRCKMTEMEEKLLKLGYPLIEDIQSGISCCNDRDDIFTCDTRVEKVVLPNPPSNSLGDGGSPLSLSALGSAAPGGTGGAPGLGAIAGGLGGAGLNFDGGLQGLGDGIMQQMGMGGAGGGQGAMGLLQMVMGMVYPSLKLMFEASIRRLTVTVKWNEGPNAKELTFVQYVTNPQQAGFTAGMVPSAGASSQLAPPTGPGGAQMPGSNLAGPMPAQGARY